MTADAPREGEESMSPIPDYGDLMTAGEYIRSVECGYFIDYDGTGRLATEKAMSDIYISPSQLQHDREKMVPIGKWTHVVWFNR